MAFVRSGPRIIKIVPTDEVKFKSFIKNHFKIIELNKEKCDLKSLISSMWKHQTLIYINSDNDFMSEFNIEKALVVDTSLQNIIITAINHYEIAHIKSVEKAPRSIVMQVLSDPNDAVRAIAEDLKGIQVGKNEVLAHQNEGTIVFFTKENINKKVNFNDLYHSAVYTTEHFAEVISELDEHSLKYINADADDTKWNEVTIAIKLFIDQKTNYDRIRFMLDSLSAGIILKEGWVAESGWFSSGNMTYQMIVYTHLTPSELKKFLTSMEYLENGERVAEIELYSKKKRVHTDETELKEYGSRENLSLHYRYELYKQMTPSDKQHLMSLEDTLFATT